MTPDPLQASTPQTRSTPMTPDPEQVALAWARRYLAGHHCDRCSREWITGSSTTILMHRCSPNKQGLPPAWSREAVLAEDREAWARRQLGPITEALEEAVGPEALLRDL